MSMQWVRDHYGVPAKRGGRILFEGEPGIIRSADHRLHVEMIDGERVILHPTWRVVYL